MVLHKVVDDEYESKDVVVAEDLWLVHSKTFAQILGPNMNKEFDDSDEICSFPNASRSIEVFFDGLHKRDFELSEV